MFVIKLGGSLWDSPRLAEWLRAAVDHGGLVLVPGGGPFADQVRESQARHGFLDSTAHRMALRAMEQYGLMLSGLQAGLTPCASAAEIRECLSAGGVAVWLPSAMVEADPDVAADWSVTSDSLSAWLCRALGADGLLIVKSAPVVPAHAGTGWLASDLLDAAFAGYLRPLRVPVRLCRADAAGNLATMLAGTHNSAVWIEAPVAQPDRDQID